MMGHRIPFSNIPSMVLPFKQILSHFYKSYYATKNCFMPILMLSSNTECALMGSIVRCNKNTDTFYVIRYKVKIWIELNSVFWAHTSAIFHCVKFITIKHWQPLLLLQTPQFLFLFKNGYGLVVVFSIFCRIKFNNCNEIFLCINWYQNSCFLQKIVINSYIIPINIFIAHPCIQCVDVDIYAHTWWK